MTLPTQKNKITLSDYGYVRDIESRVFLSLLSTFEVKVVREILNSSLTVTLDSLAEALECSKEKLSKIIDSLESIRFLSRKGEKLTIDKEMRKHYEFQIGKFDEGFVPDVEYILASLKKVPIPVLPEWYTIPRGSDNIYHSLIETYLLSPKIYESYLKEVLLKDPVLCGIMKDVFASCDFQVTAQQLREKYSLSKEQLEKHLLFLEYNFICYLSYSSTDDAWEEVVTPFYEWREYLRFLRDTQPQTIRTLDKVKRHCTDDFAFVKDMGALLKIAQQKSLTVSDKNSRVILDAGKIAPLLLNLCSEDPALVQDYLNRILMKLIVLNLIEIRGNEIFVLEEGNMWITRSSHDQAMTLYRHLLNRMQASNNLPQLYAERHIREIEKSLKRVVNSGWIYFEDFLKGLTIAVGNSESVTLKRKGKRWKYVVPNYSAEECELVKSVIFERLFEVGIVAIGTHEEKICFLITPFGRLIIGE